MPRNKFKQPTREEIIDSTDLPPAPPAPVTDIVKICEDGLIYLDINGAVHEVGYLTPTASGARDRVFGFIPGVTKEQVERHNAKTDEVIYNWVKAGKCPVKCGAYLQFNRQDNTKMVKTRMGRGISVAKFVQGGRVAFELTVGDKITKYQATLPTEGTNYMWFVRLN